MTAHHVPPAPARAVVRAVALLLLVMLAGLLIPAPVALATEEAATPPAEGERLTYEELQQQASPRAQEFFPDAYQEPSFFPWLSLPNLLAGLVMAAVLLAAYLWWQPKFAAERRAKERR